MSRELLEKPLRLIHNETFILYFSGDYSERVNEFRRYNHIKKLVFKPMVLAGDAEDEKSCFNWMVTSNMVEDQCCGIVKQAMEGANQWIYPRDFVFEYPNGKDIQDTYTFKVA